MKKGLQLKTDEPLHEWIERLSGALRLTEEQKEAMSEVSKMAYIKGSHVAFDTISARRLSYNIEYADNGIIIRDKKVPYTEVVPFGINESTMPCAISLGRMIYDDIEEIDKKTVGDCKGYELNIAIEPLNY